MGFHFWIASFFLCAVLLVQPACHAKGPPPKEYQPPIKAEVLAEPIDMPEWATDTPRNCFVGISRPCRLMAEAREQAYDSALSQILQAMGAQYTLRHVALLSGDSMHPHHSINEQLTYNARWFLRSIQENIRRVMIRQAQQGSYVCFILIHLLPEKMERLRRLSIGPRLTARVVKKQRDRVVLEVSESNGVSVTISSVKATTRVRLRYADVINYYVCRAQKEKVERHVVHIRPFSLCNSSKITYLTLTSLNPGLFYSKKTVLELKGTDEIGRPTTVSIRF